MSIQGLYQLKQKFLSKAQYWMKRVQNFPDGVSTLMANLTMEGKKWRQGGMNINFRIPLFAALSVMTKSEILGRILFNLSELLGPYL